MFDKLTQKILKKFLNYEPKTGIFTWKIFRNKQVIGYKEAGSIDNGYLTITICGHKYYTHRLAFLFMEGYLPEHEIDHINRVRGDNRWKNLRHVTSSCNSRNVGISDKNKSGVTGVCWHKSGKKWAASIKINGKNIHLGLFKIFSKAVMARWDAEKVNEWPNCNSSTSAYLYIKNNLAIEY